MRFFKMKKEIHSFLSFSFLFLCLFLVSIKGVFAANATLGISGASSVYVGNTITVTMYINSIANAEGGIGSIGGTLTYDSSKLQLVGKSNLLSFSFNDSNNKFAWVYSGSGLTSHTNLMTFTFKALETGNATVSITGASVSDTVPNRLSANVSGKTISIQTPPSSNTNLSSLIVSNSSINFQKNTTNYNISVGSDVTSINISATAEDSGARVSGTGTHSLSYGNNVIKVIVTAPSGATKTYTINVNRKDNRNSNNNLSNLGVESGSLSPEFQANVTTYRVTVPYEVTTLNVRAQAANSKAKVSITNNTNLVSEETKRVVVTVTAENGSKKEYYIDVTRAKDPNKPLSSVKHLISLIPSVGLLSPNFQSEQLEYKIYLPYEVDHIAFEYTLEDTKYGKTELNGPESLSVGSNVYTFKIYAEDGSSQDYQVNVIRGEGVDKEGSSNNAYLKEVVAKEGKLTSKFNKFKTVYSYSGKKLVLDIKPEDEKASIKVIEQDNTFYVIVTAEDGTNLVYRFEHRTVDTSKWIISVIMFALGSGSSIVGYKFLKRQKSISTKDTKKKEPKRS